MRLRRGAGCCRSVTAPTCRRLREAVDLLVLAGDIGRVRSTRNVSPLTYAEQAADFLGCRVILVPGNHEYYRGAFDEDRAALLGHGGQGSPCSTGARR